MLMRLQKYDLSVQYTPRSKMFLADILSRAYLNTTDNNYNNLDEVHSSKYVHMTNSRLDMQSEKQQQMISFKVRKIQLFSSRANIPQ